MGAANIFTYYFLLFFFLITSIVTAQQSIPVLIPLEQKNWEEWVLERPVTGDFRVGVMTDFSIPLDNLTDFYTFLPSIDNKNICVQIKSRDGRYKGNLVYELETPQSGIVRLKFPTKFKQELSKYNSSDLSIISELKSDCDGRTEFYLLSGWTNDFNTDYLTLYLNSRTPVKILLMDGVKIAEEIKCNRLTDNSVPSISYNFRCQLPRKKLEENKKILIRQSPRSPTSSPKDFGFPLILE